MSKRGGQGEGSIYQRAQDGRWVATVNLGWRGGKRVRKSLYGATRREVQEKLSKALRAAESGLHIDQDRLTVERFLAGWLESVRPPAIRHSTWKSTSKSSDSISCPAWAGSESPNSRHKPLSGRWRT